MICANQDFACWLVEAESITVVGIYSTAIREDEFRDDMTARNFPIEMALQVFAHIAQRNGRLAGELAQFK